MTQGAASQKNVVVEIAANEVSNGRTRRIEYAVTNKSSSDIWLVIDEWFVWRISGHLIVMSFARAARRTAAETFGYFLPEIAKLSPTETRRNSFQIAWPLTLSSIWNAERSVFPPAGVYKLRVEIGFGRTPLPVAQTKLKSVDETESIILKWQQLATSNAVDVVVPEKGGD